MVAAKRVRNPKGALDIPDLEARKALRKMFGLSPEITPDSNGFRKLAGIVKVGKKKFDGVEFIHQMRKE